MCPIQNAIHQTLSPSQRGKEQLSVPGARLRWARWTTAGSLLYELELEKLKRCEGKARSAQNAGSSHSFSTSSRLLVIHLRLKDMRGVVGVRKKNGLCERARILQEAIVCLQQSQEQYPDDSLSLIGKVFIRW